MSISTLNKQSIAIIMNIVKTERKAPSKADFSIGVDNKDEKKQCNTAYESMVNSIEKLFTAITSKEGKKNVSECFKSVCNTMFTTVNVNKIITFTHDKNGEEFILKDTVYKQFDNIAFDVNTINNKYAMTKEKRYAPTTIGIFKGKLFTLISDYINNIDAEKSTAIVTAVRSNNSIHSVYKKALNNASHSRSGALDKNIATLKQAETDGIITKKQLKEYLSNIEKATIIIETPASETKIETPEKVETGNTTTTESKQTA